MRKGVQMTAFRTNATSGKVRFDAAVGALADIAARLKGANSGHLHPFRIHARLR